MARLMALGRPNDCALVPRLVHGDPVKERDDGETDTVPWMGTRGAATRSAGLVSAARSQVISFAVLPHDRSRRSPTRLGRRTNGAFMPVAPAAAENGANDGTPLCVSPTGWAYA